MEHTLCVQASWGPSWAEVLFALWFVAAVGFSWWELLRLLRGELLPGLAARRLRWSARRIAVDETGRGFVEGRIARVAGTVVPRASGRSRLRGEEAVAWRYAVRSDGGQRIDGGEEGEDFLIRLSDGELVRVDAGQAMRRRALRVIGGTADRWRASRADAWLSEARVAAGDRVEVTGRLARVIDPQAAAPAPRTLPTIWALGPPGARPLIVDGVEPPTRPEGRRRSAERPGLSGRLLRRVVDAELFPVPQGHWGRVYAAALMGMAVGIVCGWAGWAAVPVSLFVIFTVADFASGTGEIGLWRRLRRTGTTRSAGRRGRVVKIRGRVEASRTFVDEHTGSWVVLARYGGWTEPMAVRGPRLFQEVRGIPFQVRISRTEKVSIDPYDACLLDATFPTLLTMAGSAARAAGPRSRHARWNDRTRRGGTAMEAILFGAAVKVGDEVEVLGLLADEADPDGTPVLQATADLPLVVRVANVAGR